jgi:hypothetical protein
VKQSAISSFIIDLCSNLYNFINQVVSRYTNSGEYFMGEGGSNCVSSSCSSGQPV